MTATTPWPLALVGTPSVAVIEQAISRQRLSHSLLLHGDDPDVLVAIALANKMARGIWAMLTRGESYRGPVLIGA